MCKLILGTVQLGLNYGINNNSGVPTIEEAMAILKIADESGIRYIDTAPAYGKSESIIGSYFQSNKSSNLKVISKFHLNDGLDAKHSLITSLQQLRVHSLHTLLFHSFDDYINNASQKIELKQSKEIGLINNLGVSVYTTDELEIVMKDKEIEVIQIPFNVFDNESKKGYLLKKAKDCGKTIHVRSIFLQGLLYKEISDLPEYLLPLSKNLQMFRSICIESGLTVNQLAMAYVMCKDYIDGVLIGVENVRQLSENIVASKITISNEIERRIDSISVDSLNLLNPVNWN